MVYNNRRKNFYKVRRYNAKTKIYPDGTRIVTYSDKYIFAPPSENSAPAPALDVFNLPANYFDNHIRDLKSRFSLNINPDCEYSVFLKRNECDLYSFLTEEQYSDLYQITVENRKPKFKKAKSDKFKKQRADNVRRAQQKLYDLVTMNEWKYFFTGTFGKVSFNPSNAKEVVKPMRIWLNHMQQRKGLKYVLVAEYQENGNIHFHGFINDALKIVDSGTRLARGIKKPVKLSKLKRLGIDEKDTQVVYNVPDWKFGFTTAIIPQGNGLYAYITKYITKDNKSIFGRYYWSSRNLVREPEIEYSDVDFESIKTKTYTVPKANIDLKYYTFFPGQTDFHYNVPRAENTAHIPTYKTVIDRYTEMTGEKPLPLEKEDKKNE